MYKQPEFTEHPTRYAELGYWNPSRGMWRIFATDGGPWRATIGPIYHTKAELLADLDRYARDYGCA